MQKYRTARYKPDWAEGALENILFHPNLHPKTGEKKKRKKKIIWEKIRASHGSAIFGLESGYGSRRSFKAADGSSKASSWATWDPKKSTAANRRTRKIAPHDVREAMQIWCPWSQDQFFSTWRAFFTSAGKNDMEGPSLDAQSTEEVPADGPPTPRGTSERLGPRQKRHPKANPLRINTRKPKIVVARHHQSALEGLTNLHHRLWICWGFRALQGSAPAPARK